MLQSSHKESVLSYFIFTLSSLEAVISLALSLHLSLSHLVRNIYIV